MSRESCSAQGAVRSWRASRPCSAALAVDDNWRNAKPAAAGLVVREGRLLLVRRAHDPWRGAWCAPAGFCDGAEHPILAAEREIFEESGVRARVVGFLGVWTDDYGEPAGVDASEWISVAYYHAEALDDGAGSPDGVETAEVRWFPWGDLPPAHDLAPPRSFPRVLDAWRVASRAGQTVTPLLDRP
jgi:ADP-ribose pyrophosphatase YjhB (NUDIX family)